MFTSNSAIYKIIWNFTENRCEPVNYRIRFSSVAVNAAGEEVSTPQVGEPNSIQGFAIAKREAVAESIMNNNPVKFVLKYDADGNCTKSTWE